MYAPGRSALHPPGPLSPHGYPTVAPAGPPRQEWGALQPGHPYDGMSWRQQEGPVQRSLSQPVPVPGALNISGAQHLHEPERRDGLHGEMVGNEGGLGPEEQSFICVA
jgi:hypothetical protein